MYVHNVYKKYGCVGRIEYTIVMRLVINAVHIYYSCIL